MTQYLVTIQLKTSYTLPVLAEDKEQSTTAALERDPPAKPIQEAPRTAKKILRLTQTDQGLRYVEEKSKTTKAVR